MLNKLSVDLETLFIPVDTSPFQKKNGTTRTWLSPNELIEWYSIHKPREKILWAINIGLVELGENNRFIRRNNEPRSIDEMPKQRRFLIHARDTECVYCGKDENLVVDHVIPLSAWPSDMIWLANTSSNLCSACWDCNESKSNKLNFSGWANIYPITTNCESCKNLAKHQSEKVSSWCMQCQNESLITSCLLPGIECECESY